LRELLFYTVDSEYIKYLSEFDNHVSYNKEEIGHARPYLVMYKYITNNKNNFLKTISCDFKLLEEKCKLYTEK